MADMKKGSIRAMAKMFESTSMLNAPTPNCTAASSSSGKLASSRARKAINRINSATLHNQKNDDDDDDDDGGGKHSRSISLVCANTNKSSPHTSKSSSSVMQLQAKLGLTMIPPKRFKQNGRSQTTFSSPSNIATKKNIDDDDEDEQSFSAKDEYHDSRASLQSCDLMPLKKECLDDEHQFKERNTQIGNDDESVNVDVKSSFTTVCHTNTHFSNDKLDDNEHTNSSKESKSKDTQTRFRSTSSSVRSMQNRLGFNPAMMMPGTPRVRKSASTVDICEASIDHVILRRPTVSRHKPRKRFTKFEGVGVSQAVISSMDLGTQDLKASDSIILPVDNVESFNPDVRLVSDEQSSVIDEINDDNQLKILDEINHDGVCNVSNTKSSLSIQNVDEAPENKCTSSDVEHTMHDDIDAKLVCVDTSAAVTLTETLDKSESIDVEVSSSADDENKLELNDAECDDGALNQASAKTIEDDSACVDDDDDDDDDDGVIDDDDHTEKHQLTSRHGDDDDDDDDDDDVDDDETNDKNDAETDAKNDAEAFEHCAHVINKEDDVIDDAIKHDEHDEFDITNTNHCLR